MKLEIETYEENGKDMVWIGEENGSGCKYEYKSEEDLVIIVTGAFKNAYVKELEGK